MSLTVCMGVVVVVFGGDVQFVPGIKIMDITHVCYMYMYICMYISNPIQLASIPFCIFIYPKKKSLMTPARPRRKLGDRTPASKSRFRASKDGLKAEKKKTSRRRIATVSHSTSPIRPDSIVFLVYCLIIVHSNSD